MSDPIARRAFLSLFAAAPLARPQVLYRDYSKCLPDFLRHLVGESVKMRNGAIAALTSPEAVLARKQWVRKTFWDLIGSEPPRTPLNIRTVGSFERAGYRVEKLVYESQPELFITANLYLPKKGQGPFPGVLFQMGHSLNGKAAAPYQKCCQGLVQLGFVVLAFDPMGQGERTYYPKPDGPLTRLPSADDEHTVPGQQMLLQGLTSTWIQTWDAVRSLDVLASHPLVDPKRLASTGNSGGGTVTMLLAAVDDRLACAAPSCPNSENFACEEFNPPGSTDDAEQNFVASGRIGFDRWDLLYPLAPKPLLVLVSAKDFFGTYSPSYIKNGRQEFARLADVYRTLGKPDQIRWWESPLPHGLNHSARMQIYDWFRRWLQGETKPVEGEPTVAVEKDETLWVTQKGSALRSLGSRRPLSFVPMARPADPAAVDLRKLLGMEELYERPRKIKLGEAPSEGCLVEAWEISTATHVWVPYWLFRPRTASRGTMVLAPSNGRNSGSAEGGLFHELAAAGWTVIAPDVRAMGDLTPEAGRGATRYTLHHASEHDYAWASAILGPTLAGQRVTDLISILRTLPAGEPVTLAAAGKMTVPALFAAAMQPGVSKVYLAGGLASYQHLMQVEEYVHPFANFVPGILRRTDLPQVATGVKGLVLGGMVDAAGKPLRPEEAKALYPGARIHGDAAWTAKRLLEI